MRIPFTLLVALLLIFQVGASEVENLLKSMEDLSYTQIETPKGFKEAYELRIKQPIDHSNPLAGYFEQKVYLAHNGFTAPTIFATEGYSADIFYTMELALLLRGNQVEIEHRYFGSSIPEGTDYKYLNLEQATADLHRISELLKKVYSGKWISSGISKGGQTTVFYKYFYPNDMDAWVPYVAPFNLSLEDERIYTFLDTVGTRECRDKIEYLQKRILAARDTVLPILKRYTKSAGIDHTYLGIEEAFEYTVLEYSFSFWQWGIPCEAIPDSNATLSQAFEHLFSVSDIGFFSDKEMTSYASHYYQAATEMGYYGYNIEDFKELLQALPTNKNPLATFPPAKMETHFSDSLIKLVYNWLATNGNNMLYIYGASDTWSATSVPPSDFTNSVWLFMPGKSHSTARIKNFSNEEFNRFSVGFEEYTGLKIKRKHLSRIN